MIFQSSTNLNHIGDIKMLEKNTYSELKEMATVSDFALFILKESNKRNIEEYLFGKILELLLTYYFEGFHDLIINEKMDQMKENIKNMLKKGLQ